MGKIVIGKPSAPEAVNNSGYIKPDVLRGFFEVANKKINWRTGLMTWKYSYDRDC
jgi:chitinase